MEVKFVFAWKVRPCISELRPRRRILHRAKHWVPEVWLSCWRVNCWGNWTSDGAHL